MQQDDITSIVHTQVSNLRSWNNGYAEVEMTAATGAAMKVIAFVFDSRMPRELAGFYGRLLGWTIDESVSDETWVEIADPAGGPAIAFQFDAEHEPPVWPGHERPQRAHLDIRVETVQEGQEIAERAGATALPQPDDQLDALFRVYADPEGHPFCMCACSS